MSSRSWRRLGSDLSRNREAALFIRIRSSGWATSSLTPITSTCLARAESCSQERGQPGVCSTATRSRSPWRGGIRKLPPSYSPSLHSANDVTTDPPIHSAHRTDPTRESPRPRSLTPREPTRHHAQASCLAPEERARHTTCINDALTPRDSRRPGELDDPGRRRNGARVAGLPDRRSLIRALRQMLRRDVEARVALDTPPRVARATLTQYQAWLPRAAGSSKTRESWGAGRSTARAPQ
jgi:hypothetical protein